MTIFIKTDNLSELSTYFFLWIFLRWQSGRAKIHKRQFFNDISFLAQLFDDSVRNKIPRKCYKRNMLIPLLLSFVIHRMAKWKELPNFNISILFGNVSHLFLFSDSEVLESFEIKYTWSKSFRENLSTFVSIYCEVVSHFSSEKNVLLSKATTENEENKIYFTFFVFWV